MFWQFHVWLKQLLFRLSLIAFLAVSPVYLLGHTTYLRPLEYQDAAGKEREVIVFNGTFEESVDSIPANRVRTVLLSTSEGEKELSKEDWIRGKVGSLPWRTLQKAKSYLGGMDLRRTSTFKLSPEEEGACYLGVEFYPARVAMDLDKFKAYLKEVGLDNEPIARQEVEITEAFIRERYTKTAKALLFTGNDEGSAISKSTGLVAEIVPLADPRSISNGDSLEVLLLLKGKPVPNQVLVVGSEGGISGQPDGRMILRSGQDGVVKVPITKDGEWWMEFNHMEVAPPDDEVNYITYWTTLTFEI